MEPVADQQTPGTHPVSWPPATGSQVKQKFYVTSKSLLFKVILTLQHRGNEERVFFALGHGQELTKKWSFSGTHGKPATLQMWHHGSVW